MQKQRKWRGRENKNPTCNVKIETCRVFGNSKCVFSSLPLQASSEIQHLKKKVCSFSNIDSCNEWQKAPKKQLKRKRRKKAHDEVLFSARIAETKVYSIHALWWSVLYKRITFPISAHCSSYDPILFFVFFVSSLSHENGRFFFLP